MTKKILTLLIVACAAFQAQVVRGDVWEEIAKWEMPQDGKTNTPSAIIKMIQKTGKGDQSANEANLIKVISNDSATVHGRQFACRMLQRIGTEKCVAFGPY